MDFTRTHRVGVIGVAAAVVFTTAAWKPAASGPEASPAAATCQFIIKASNRHSFDVFIDFYDSTVRGRKYWDKTKPLMYNGGRVQNRRIPRGQSMEQRVQADGDCEKDRNWLFQFRIGSKSSQQTINRSTFTAKQRTIDLGPSNTWGD